MNYLPTVVGYTALTVQNTYLLTKPQCLCSFTTLVLWSLFNFMLRCNFKACSWNKSCCHAKNVYYLLHSFNDPWETVAHMRISIVLRKSWTNWKPECRFIAKCYAKLCNLVLEIISKVLFQKRGFASGIKNGWSKKRNFRDTSYRLCIEIIPNKKHKEAQTSNNSDCEASETVLYIYVPNNRYG